LLIRQRLLLRIFQSHTTARRVQFVIARNTIKRIPVQTPYPRHVTRIKSSGAAGTFWPIWPDAARL
jgi:hypothetical protein